MPVIPDPEVDEEEGITPEWIVGTRLIRQWVNGEGVRTGLLYEELERWARYWEGRYER